MNPAIFQFAFKAVVWFNIIPWFSLSIFVKNLTDKIYAFTRKVRDKNALIVNFKVQVKPEKMGKKGWWYVRRTGQTFCWISYHFFYKFGTFFNDLILGSRHKWNLTLLQKIVLTKYKGIIFHSWKFHHIIFLSRNTADQ